MRIGASFVLAGFLSGCSVVPQLSEATGRADSPIFISDVVTRVKCEIADSFEELRPHDEFNWIRDWTAKVDLTLQANNQAGISPSGSYTKFQKNAFNTDAGSTSLTSNTIGSVSQFFTLAAGANVGEQALRTEVVSFTVGVEELHEWRGRIAAMERAPDFPPERRICEIANARELEGDLGLREWVRSALMPVYVREPGFGHELWAGDHPSPGTAKGPTPPSAVGLPEAIPGQGDGDVLQDAPTETQTKEITDRGVGRASTDYCRRTSPRRDRMGAWANGRYLRR